jgi:DNA repair exonuclease SbcCD ATPase subunit
MTSGIESLKERSNKYKEKMKSLEDENAQFSSTINSIKTEVCEHAQQLHDLIECHKIKLLDELSEIQKNRVKEIDTVHGEIEQYTSMLDSFKTYLEEITAKGTACDIVGEANCLRAKLKDLLDVEVMNIEKSSDLLGSFEVSWFASDSFLREDTDVVGSITKKKNIPSEELFERFQRTCCL